MKKNESLVFLRDHSSARKGRKDRRKKECWMTMTM